MTKQQPSLRHKVTNYGIKGFAFGALGAIGQALVVGEVLTTVVPFTLIVGTGYGIYHLATRGNK